MKKFIIIFNIFVFSLIGFTAEAQLSGLRVYENGGYYRIPEALVDSIVFFNIPAPDAGTTPGEGNWESPYTVWQIVKGVRDNEAVWTTGYIVGYADAQLTDTQLSERTAIFGSENALNSNILLAASPNETNWEYCIPVQLAYNTPGREISLGLHPEYLGKQVSVYGYSNYYLGVHGISNCNAYNWGDQGVYITPPQYFIRATEIIDGAKYVMVADGKYVAQNLYASYTYGYLYCDEAVAGESVISKIDNSYTFTSAGDGLWIIKDSYGRYLYQNATGQNFQVSYALPDSNYLWEVSFLSDGTARIRNIDRGTWIQFDPNYSSYGCYSTERGIMPVLYVLP